MTIFRVITKISGLCLLGLLAYSGQAWSLYTYDGTNGVNAVYISAGGCTGCHGSGSGSSALCDGAFTATAEAFINTTSATTRYNSVFTCASEISDKMGASPSYGVRMPQGGPYIGTTQLNNWISGGRLRNAAPTVTTTSMTAPFVDNDSATLRGTVDPNGIAVSSTLFNYGISPSVGSTLNVTNPSGSGGNNVSSSISGTISNLQCGTGYSFRARSTNTTGTGTGPTRTFTTDACSNPSISFSGTGSSPAARVSVSKDLTFTQTSLGSISASDVDVGSVTWSADDSGSSGSVVINNASTGAFTYTAPSTAGLDSFILTVTDSDSFTPGGSPTAGNTDSVTVYVSIVDNAPEFRASLPAGAVITMDALTVGENNGASAGQAITMYATDADGDSITWSVSTPPANGTLSAFGSGTGPLASPSTNTITYTPNVNVDVNDAFTITISDGVTAVNLPVTANVTPDPDPPTAGDDGPFDFDIGVPVTVTVTTNDSDVDTGDSVTVQAASLTTSAGGGALAPVGGTQVQYTSTMTQFTNDTFQYRAIDTTALTSNLATVTMRPRDSDGDGVINYLDNCAATPNAAQTDTDGDQIINVNTMMDPADPFRGGDACDVDDDGDLITDIDEINNSLDPLDPSDALLDNDGDGISNIDEINVFGTNPNLANLTIDATGYWTPYDLIPPLPSEIHSAATTITSSDPGPYRPGDNTITWTPSNGVSADLEVSDPGNLVSNPPQQAFYVRPLLNFAADQLAEEGDTVNVQLSINGDAPVYPVTVNYSVSGTATPGVDFTAPAPVSGSVVFNDTTPQNISFMLAAADGADPGETIVFTLDSATNAAIGDSNTHQVTIIESNLAPQARIRFVQGANEQSSAVAGTVDIDAVVTDVNVADTHTCDWSGTDGALMPPVATACAPAWTTPALLADTNYLIDVVVTDNGAPAESIRVTRILNVVAAPALMAVDTDGDGTNDDVEGFDDSDGDGIPDYLDAIDNTSMPNILADQTNDYSNSYVLETEPGLTLKIGSISQASGSYGALITDTEITDHGSPTGGPAVNPNDSFEHFGGIFNFEISGLVPGGTARIVIPLQASIPRNAVLRKYNPATGWGNFAEDASNRIESAAGAPGACPSPGSTDYQAGLGYLHNCIQLTLSDGGPNDTNGVIDGVISDPVAIGAQLTDPEAEEVESGSSRVSPTLLLFMLLVALFGQWRRMGRGLPV